MTSERAWVGIDMGARQSFVCVIDSSGTALMKQSVATKAADIRALLESLGAFEIEQIAVEAGGTGMRATRELISCGLPIVLYEAQSVSRYLRIRPNKSDRYDAQGLAEIARFGLPSLPRVYLKSEAIQNIRSDLAFRHKVVVQRTAFEGMLRSLLRMHGVVLTGSFRNKGFKDWVLSEVERLSFEKSVNISEQVEPLLDLCLYLRRYQDVLTKRVEQHVQDNDICSSFTKVPGVGPLCALSFYTAIEDPFRFTRNVSVGAYFGLTPKTCQSGTSLQHGRISKRGSRLTRTHLVQSAGILMRSGQPSRLKDWGLMLKKRVGWSKARVEVARKLSILLLTMWKSGQSYRPHC